MFHRGVRSMLDGHLDGAIEYFSAALRLRPDFPECRCNRATLLYATGRFNEAMADYEASWNAALPPFPRAYLFLLLDRYREGWAAFEAGRQHEDPTRRHFAAPEWRGQELHGRHLFLWIDRAAEGFGDMIQFCRFAQIVARQCGGRVTLEVPAKLQELMQTLADVEVIAKGEPTPPHDFQLPLMNTPRIIGFDPNQMLTASPYLHADPIRVEAWRQPSATFNVGIAWQAGPGTDGIDGFCLPDGTSASPLAVRSIPLLEFAPLSRLPDIRLVSLQYRAQDQLDRLPPGMVVDGEDIELSNGFTDTAAIIANMDLVICADVVTAHLAGALGKPVWVLLNEVPDWRWLLDRSDSPWYPTARLFRRRRGEEWADVMERVARELRACVEPRPPLAVTSVSRLGNLGAQILAAIT